MSVVKRVLKGLLKFILRLLLACVIFIIVIIVAFTFINGKEMNKCIDNAMTNIMASNNVTEVSAGEYSDMRIYGIMNFHVKQYDIEGQGNLSVMTVNVGVMQMATMVFTPYEKDIPLLSVDYLYMLPIRKVYVELYDLVENKDDTYMAWMNRFKDLFANYSDLKDSSASSAWYENLLTSDTYKSGTIADDKRFNVLLLDTLNLYFEMSDSYSELDQKSKAVKADIIKDYSDKLIDQGGISTSFFKKSLGVDVTRDFFDKVFFGSEKYR